MIPAKSRVSPERTHQRGAVYALAAYLIWGLFPIYWKQLEGIPALQLVCHRIAWSFILLAAIVLVSGGAGRLLAALNRHALRTYIAAALLISANWYAYVWAVTHDMIVEASLGYFINPLFSILLGVILFRERLRPLQWLAISIAAGGVLYLTLTLGSFPWLAVLLAATFGMYGAIKKAAPLGSLFGMTTETAALFLPAVAYLITEELAGRGAFLHSTLKEDVMMAGGGVVTAVPLLLFAAAASRVPLTTIGILQYMTPTLQLVLGLVVYNEPFPMARLVGFAMVWIALVLFWSEGVAYRRRAWIDRPNGGGRAAGGS